MFTRSCASSIEATGIDAYREFINPWDADLKQISPGRFRARMEYVQINGILLYREHWTHRVMTATATPPGFFMFGGSMSQTARPNWCGVELNSQCLAYGYPSSEVEFVVPEDSRHMVLLVPCDVLRRYLGEESAKAVLSDVHWLTCELRLSHRFLALIDGIIERYWAQPGLLDDDRLCRTIESQLLGSLAEVLLGSDAEGPGPSPRKRYSAVCRAIRFAEGRRAPLSVQDLSEAVGVSERALERGFRETLEITPRRYLRWSRINGLQRDLRATEPGTATVAAIATRWGFEELGRTAVYYKELLGESPSTTLAYCAGPRPVRLADSLRNSAGL